MDLETAYTVVGVVAFGLIVYFTLKNDEAKNVQTKEQKKYEIISAYKQEMQTILEPLQDDQDARQAKKKELLYKYNQELAMNIFFDAMDAKDALVELSQEK